MCVPLMLQSLGVRARALWVECGCSSTQAYVVFELASGGASTGGKSPPTSAGGVGRPSWSRKDVVTDLGATNRLSDTPRGN